MRLVLELRLDTNNPELRHLCIVKSNYLHHNFKKEALILRMDENLVFHNMDKTIPICEIAIQQKGLNKKTPSKYKDEDHIDFLKKIYSEDKTIFSQNELKNHIEDKFKCSDKPAREFVVYFEEKGWIKNKSNKSNKKEYTLNPNINQS